MKIPPKFAAIFGLWTTILLAIGGGTIALTDIVPPDYVHFIKNWAIFLGTINSLILTGMSALSGPGVGPLAPPPTTDEAKVIQAQAVSAAVKNRS